MQNQESIPPYRFYTTSDGSPTLELSYEPELKEFMHNSQGAFEESVYIYGDVIREAFKNLSSASVLSVGLGLGYNELITVSLALAGQIEPEKLSLVSYEKETFLQEYFLAFLQEESLPVDFSHAYQWILDACSKRFGVEPLVIRNALVEMKKNKTWDIRQDFDPLKLDPSDRWNIFLYDAFSSKMSPQLWSEAALDSLLKNHTSTPCYFTTYAAKGSLNRALKANGFVLQDRIGFAGKRESTYGVKG